MSADSDYARIVELLSNHNFPPYVSYVSADHVSGMHSETKQDRIVVRVRDGKIVQGSTHLTFNANGSGNAANDTNPVSHPLFDPSCYRAKGERDASFEGTAAVEISLVPTCKDPHPSDHNYPFTTLYADAHTMRPLDVTGSVPPGSDNTSVSEAFDQRFAEFDGHVMPSSIKFDLSGSGIMFWLQIHLTEQYSDFRFLNSYSG